MCDSIADHSTPTTIEPISINTAGSGTYFYSASSGFDLDTIESGEVIVFDNDATDDPAFIQVTITGHFDAPAPK